MPLTPDFGNEEMNNDEQKPRSPLIKKGTVSYKPVPFLSDEPPAKAAPKGPEKTVQVLKEHGPAAPPQQQQQPEQPQQQQGPSPEEVMARVKEEAQRLISKARAEADKIIAEAQAKSKKLIEESKLYLQTAEQNARREGLEEGQKAGYEAGQNELREIMESARDAMRQAVDLRETLERSAEKDLAQLAVKIAERVIGSEVTLNPNVIISMVKANLERVKERENVTIRVHQDDFDTVKKNKEVFSRFVPEVRAIEIQTDPRVERGGCIVETNLGTVDARISTQLQAIALAFAQIDEKTEEAEAEPDSAPEP